MEVNFTPEIEKKLNDLAALSGRPAHELVQAAVVAMFDEPTEKRNMLDSRYDDLESGKVQPIPGEEALPDYTRELMLGVMTAHDWV